MTLQLILARHAKSSWDNPQADDHSRGLNQRGRASAAAIGQWLMLNEYAPDLVLCSSAERTKETWALIAKELNASPEIRFESALYLAAPEQILSLLKTVKGPASVLMLAHNPGSALLATALAAEPAMHPQFERYPTAATTVLNFEAENWHEIRWGQGKIIDFVVPRDLI